MSNADANKRVIKQLEELLAEARKGGIYSFAYVTDSPNNTITGWINGSVVLLGLVTGLVHQLAAEWNSARSAPKNKTLN